jgi:hypothetical protein
LNRTLADRIIAWVALSIAAAFVFVFWQARSAGRYIYNHRQSTDNAKEDITMFDTSTGTVYSFVPTRKTDGSETVSFVEMEGMGARVG